MQTILENTAVSGSGLILETNFPDHPVFVNLRRRIPRNVLAEISKMEVRISGSIILQAFYNVDWNSDIDLYECVPLDYAKSAQAGKFSPLEDFFYNNGGITEDTAQYDYSEYDPWLRIAQTRTYRLGDSLYQIIGVAECELEDQFRGFLQTVFDFPICKNYIQFDQAGFMTLWMAAPEDVKLRQTNLQFGIRPCETLLRVKKYRERGIKVLDDGSAISPTVRVHGVFLNEPGRTTIMPRSPVKVGGGMSCLSTWYDAEDGKLRTYDITDHRCKRATCQYANESHIHMTGQLDVGTMRQVDYVIIMGNDPY